MEHLKIAAKSLKLASEETLSEFMDLEKNGSVAQICTSYRELTETLDVCRAYIKIIEDMETHFSEQVIPDIFESMQMSGEPVFDNRRFIIDAKMYANTTLEKQPRAFEWLRSHGYGEAIREGINGNTLSAIVRDHFERTRETPPLDAITIFTKKKTTLKKVK